MLGRPKLVRHFGASFVPGSDLVHAWFRNETPESFLNGWRALEELGLAGSPIVDCVESGAFHASARTYPFLPLTLIERVVAASKDEQQDALSFAESIRGQVHDSAVYAKSYALHREIAISRGWPAHPLMLGRFMTTVFGMGRLHRIGVMNARSNTPITAALVGGRKCSGRAWLQAIGLPTAPGGVADNPQNALRLAEKVGWPIVLKRPIGGNGDSVVLSICDSTSCLEAAARLLNGGHPYVVVERMLAGVELRAHFVNGKLFELRSTEKKRIAPDGFSSLAHLIERQHPEFWRTVTGAERMRQRLTFVLWHQGVRCFDELMRVVPDFGEPIQISSGVQTGPAGLLPLTTLHRDDRRQLERAFDLLGSPSGGCDLLLPSIGGRLNEGGAILEMNIPCGMVYLSDPVKAARAELSSWIGDLPDFRASRGCIPFIVVGKSADERYPQDWIRLKRKLRTRYRRAVAVDLEETGGWLSAVMSDAEAILLSVSDRAALDCGLPANSRPIYVAPSANESSTPILDATVRNCGSGWQRASVDSVMEMLEHAPSRRRHYGRANNRDGIYVVRIRSISWKHAELRPLS